ncbi:MAG: hypothetical protein ACYC63_10940 [Armatimonadota bacterium]
MEITGRREQIEITSFRGYDADKNPLFALGWSPQENVPPGLLMDARNLRFTPDGRAYWYRNQLKVGLPSEVCAHLTVSEIDTTPLGLVRSGNVVMVTTTQPHGLSVNNRVLLLGTSPVSFAGWWKVSSLPSDTTFTFTQSAADETGGGGTVTPNLPQVLTEYVAEGVTQLLTITDEGNLWSRNADWNAAPTPSGSTGYTAYTSGTNTQRATGLPTSGRFGFASVRNRLVIASGKSPGFDTGMATKLYDGSSLVDIGLMPPIAAASGAMDGSGAGNALEEGTYSYQVVFGSAEFESMPGPVADVKVQYVPATATIRPTTISTVANDGDTLTIGSRTYRLRYCVDNDPGPGAHLPDDLAADDILLMGVTGSGELTNKYNFRIIAGAINHGSINTRPDGAVIETLPNTEVSAEAYYTAGSAVGMTVTAKAAGAEGNTLAVATNAASRFTVPATFSGAQGPCHIDLSAIPKGESGSGVTYRKLYRAYTPSLQEGARGESFQLLTRLDNNTTQTYADNEPQYDLGSEIAFDHAIPPRGSHLVHHRDRLWMAGIASASPSYSDAPTGNLQNVLFYSQLDEPYYWPLVNQFQVGSSAPIVGLASWHDQLLIFKSDSVWLLTGYSEADFTLSQVPGLTGAIEGHVAVSPHGVLYAGYSGWMLFTDSGVRQVITYKPKTAFDFDQPGLTPPTSAPYPCVCWHEDRFQIAQDGYVLSWRPDGDSWEIARRDVIRGLRAFDFGGRHSHLLGFMAWGDPAETRFSGTVLDVPGEAGGVDSFGDKQGTSLDPTLGEVQVDFPPLTAPHGQLVNALWVQVRAQWVEPPDPQRSLYLHLFDETTKTWKLIGQVPQSGRLGLPSGNLRERLRLRLSGAECVGFVLYGISVEYLRVMAGE